MLKIEIDDDHEKANTIKILASCELNFMLGSGASWPCIEVLGDLESEIQGILSDGDGNTVKKVNDYFSGFNNHINSLRNYDLIGLCTNSNDNKKIEDYENFLKQILGIIHNRNLKSKKANIFTTNYDLFIELAASNLPSLNINDGFNRTSSLFGNYQYDTTSFFKKTILTTSNGLIEKEIPTINLIKIHGSLNWKILGKQVINEIEPTEIKKIKTKDELLKLEKGIVLPLKEKYVKTVIDNTYYDLLRIFSAELERPNSSLITFGFSFKDEHIYEVAKRVLVNPSLIMILIAHDEKDLLCFEQMFANHNNVYCLHPKQGKKLSFNDFLKILSVL